MTMIRRRKEFIKFFFVHTQWSCTNTFKEKRKETNWDARKLYTNSRRTHTHKDKSNVYLDWIARLLADDLKKEKGKRKIDDNSNEIIWVQIVIDWHA